ncbi:OmpA family protein [Marinomonas aquiplantarum]|uniref:Outer membrane protein OmpA-like peptidoglycan-associated protein n=1 Tax=Marinomonas aquiplantarum TaxID=491951 RepID=A0A366D488_9GAMM|nr:OmpA family protein [Marinomonas aquiplantarum]RBO84128.1 outer membrane protein OmpA-like peptidoglycan-associated protein [Marinomonas aquiplantarum]
MNRNTDNEASLGNSEEMLQFRQLILGKDNQLVRDAVEENARDLVADVLTEALHDRQKADGSVSGVLTPLVEKAVENSVNDRKEQFVSYLYPLVGSLVRKSVSAFLAEIIEQTNEMLESSLTYKGLRWRFEARRAGVSYSQYVVQQTFVFRVEQVLLIHRETGLLLKTVIRDKTQTADGDMFSAMLTAINDFVADSFTHQSEGNEQSLDEIKTDDFTLLIKQGPKAVLVAAITGNPPANIGSEFQKTLENIHQIYNDELNNFEGDASVFENTEQQLNSCLIEQQKESDKQESPKKIPWLVIVPLLMALSAFSYWIVKHWQLDNLLEKVLVLDEVSGIVLLDAELCDDKICVKTLRDPAAQETMSWLMSTGFSQTLFRIDERSYQSLDMKLLPEKLQRIHHDFPEIGYNQTELKFFGSISNDRFQELRAALSSMLESATVNNVLSDVQVSPQGVDERLLNQMLFEKNKSEIRDASFLFNMNEKNLVDSNAEAVKDISEKIIYTTALSKKLGQRFLVVIMGASSNDGSDGHNQKLSLERAETVQGALITQGVDPDVLRVAGLGGLGVNDDARRVIFEVIRLEPDNIEKAKN